MSNKFGILHQNVRSIGNAKELLEEALKENEEVKVLCISEHWKTEEQLQYHAIANFTLQTHFCRAEKEHGGVAIYTKNGFQVKERKDIKKISKKGKFECVAVEYYIGKSKQVCVAVYNDGNDDILTEGMEKILQKLHNENVKVVIAGDFNINMEKKSSKRRNILDLMGTYNVEQTINQPTRITGNSATCIDGIFTNSELLYEVSIFDAHISDHTAQKIVFTIDQEETKFKYRRMFSERNFQLFKDALREQNWDSLYEINKKDINSQFDHFHTLYQEIFNKLFPIKKIKVRGKPKMDKMDPETATIKEKLDILLTLSTHDESFREMYRKTKLEYDNHLKRRTKDKFDRKIKTSENKNKTMWSFIKSMNNSQKTNQFQVNGDPTHIVNDMNTFFINAATRLTANITRNRSEYQYVEENKSLLLRPINLEETKEIITSLKNKDTSGYDGISSKIIKQTAEEIVKPMNHIINNSLKCGIFPERMKIAIVKPIHKKGDVNEYGNYRPISILPSFSKILEIAYCRQIMNFLTENAFFKESQHGYRKGKSIQTAIFRFVSKIVEAFENKEYAMGIFLDLTKAYDCLSVDELMRKLEKYGIRGPALKWAKSYFASRKQMVQVESQGRVFNSELEEIILGIPQGSIAGPLFFLIYINDFDECLGVEEGQVIAANYVDDTNLLAIHKIFSELRMMSEKLIKESENWFEMNNLVLNKEKTRLVLFTPSNMNSGNLSINQNTNLVEEHTKLLGMYIDSNLNWNEHVNYLSGKLRTNIYGLRTMARYIGYEALKALYHATIESRLRFGMIFYGTSNIENLFILQKKALRIVNNLKYNESCRTYFKKNGILTIYALYIHECLLFMKKNDHLFQKYRNEKSFHETRSLDYIFPKFKLTTSQKQVEYRCLKLFNSLPGNIKAIQDTRTFKKKIYKFLLNLEPYNMASYTG